jgi:Family of unknown function (DUF6498)
MKKFDLNIKSPSTILLIIANLIPVYGVLFLDWKVFSLIFLFWLENVIVGFYNVLKMLSCKPENGTNWLGKIFIVPFFTIHYGIFTVVHGIFVFVLFGSKTIQFSGFPGPELLLELLSMNNLSYVAMSLFLSHGFSFLWNYIGKKEYETTDLKTLMGKPYGRIVVLHLTILIGGFLLMALNSPIFGLLLFIALKIVMDISAHNKEHKTKS